MLSCIACSKQINDGEDTSSRGGGAAAASTKPAVKSLTSQIKDVVLRLSGTYRQCKSNGPSSTANSYKKGHAYHHHRRPYVVDYSASPEVRSGANANGNTNGNGAGSGGGDDDDYCSYRQGSSSSTPAWNFTRFDPHTSNMTQYESWIANSEAVDTQCYDGLPVMLEEEEAKEWVAQVEPGVHITFLTLPHGGNDLKRIRFDREMFNKWQAQRWWGENYDRIMELYNVRRFNKQALPTPPRSEDERDSLTYSRMGSRTESPAAPPLTNNTAYNATTTFNRAPTSSSSSRGVFQPAPDPTEHFFPQYQSYINPCMWPAGNARGQVPSFEASRTTTSSRDEAASVSVSVASDNLMEATEWVEEDEPGVYITIRQVTDGSRDLRRVRFSREKFGEMNAKLWWEENRDRIHAQYL